MIYGFSGFAFVGRASQLSSEIFFLSSSLELWFSFGNGLFHTVTVNHKFHERFEPDNALSDTVS